MATKTPLSTLEICEGLYGGRPADLNAFLAQVYEPNAGIYENPLITATSRSMIGDLMQASWAWSEVDVYKPVPFATRFLLGRNISSAESGTWFRALRVWSEVVDICETESFDGCRKSIVEHTVHFLILPGLHFGRTGRLRYTASESSLDISSTSHLLYSIPHFQRTSDPSLAIPGTRLSWPSPLHFELRMLTRLEFNGERILHHRDIWDVKDLVALVPGAKLVQYIGSRLAGRALAKIGHLGAWLWGKEEDAIG